MDDREIRLACLQQAVRLLPENNSRDTDTVRLLALDLEAFVVGMEPRDVIEKRICERREASMLASIELRRALEERPGAPKPFDRSPTYDEYRRG